MRDLIIALVAFGAGLGIGFVVAAKLIEQSLEQFLTSYEDHQ